MTSGTRATAHGEGNIGAEPNYNLVEEDAGGGDKGGNYERQRLSLEGWGGGRSEVTPAMEAYRNWIQIWHMNQERGEKRFFPNKSFKLVLLFNFLRVKG